MTKQETITITNSDGEDIEYELVTTIENEATNVHYIVYKDLLDDDSSEDIDLYISRVVIENDKEIIEEITDEEEWNNVAKVLDDMLKGIE